METANDGLQAFSSLPGSVFHCTRKRSHSVRRASPAPPTVKADAKSRSSKLRFLLTPFGVVRARVLDIVLRTVRNGDGEIARAELSPFGCLICRTGERRARYFERHQSCF